MPLESPAQTLLATARRISLSGTACTSLVVGACLYVIVWPMTQATYLPLTDLPFHAAQASIFRHYADPAFHFREQFELRLFEVPYVSLYGLGALFMLVVPAMTAVKAAVAVMLALLPAGLAVLFWGMRKSPTLGVLGLLLVWGHLTHWGFLNFVGALGLFAMVVGVTLRLLDRPTRGRSLALLASLAGLFFTHVFRFPYALIAVIGTTAIVWPLTRRARPVVLPLLASFALLGAWSVARPEALRTDFGAPTPDFSRLAIMPRLWFDSYVGDAETGTLTVVCQWLGAAALLSTGARLWGSPLHDRSRRERALALGGLGVAIACALGMTLSYLGLPSEVAIGRQLWWYIYPREATSVLFLALSLFPDLPRTRLPRTAVTFLISSALGTLGTYYGREFAYFEAQTRDFETITQRLPLAPKLLYLVFEHEGSRRTATPFLHLPAYVQAERGGWLSFHFASMGASPIAYKKPSEPGAIVPPDVPPRWEWTPGQFRMREHGAFFDWFLVRSTSRPHALFAADGAVQAVAHEGTWWLFARR